MSATTAHRTRREIRAAAQRAARSAAKLVKLVNAHPEQAELLAFLSAVRGVLDTCDDTPEIALELLTNMLGAFLEEASPIAARRCPLPPAPGSLLERALRTNRVLVARIRELMGYPALPGWDGPGPYQGV